MSRSTKNVICLVGIFVVITVVRNLRTIFNVGNTGIEIVLPLLQSRHFPSPTGGENKNGSIPFMPNRLIHKGEFGLGHRLLRAATSFHLGRTMGVVGKIKFDWGKCYDSSNNTNTSQQQQQKDATGISIFPYLFGEDDWWLSEFNQTLQHGKTVFIQNDVWGYLPTQTFLDHRIPLEGGEHMHKNQSGPFLSKISSDVSFYRQLEERFQYRDKIEEFMEKYKFQNHQVIGLHIRTGNGEKAHFLQAGRGIVNETTFFKNLVDLIGSTVTETTNKKNTTTNPPLLFLATDTPYVVSTISNLTESIGIPTIVFPQIRVPDYQGVTFSAWVGNGEEKCLLGWQAMVIDMLLLRHADILIAARHSTFTQSLPLTLAMSRNRNEEEEKKKNHHGASFCEVSDDATRMSCFQNIPAWLFRDNPQHETNYALPVVTSTTINSTLSVHHKSLIFLPEKEKLPEFYKLMEYVSRDDDHEGERRTMSYGRRFNPRYRNQKTSDHPGWNFT